MKLVNYKRCVYCNSKNFQKVKVNNSNKNFYIKAIENDLNLKENFFKLIKTYQCLNCKVIFNNPWFSKNISKKIYTNIYGQHHNNWQNLIDFVNKKKLPDHGNLFKILDKNLKIKNYAEYNSPFMGLYLNFFDKKFSRNKKIYKKFHDNLLNYLSARQLAGTTKVKKKNSALISKYNLKKIKKFKEKFKNDQLKNKILFFDNSSLHWGFNDNYKSVNSKTYLNEMYDTKIIHFDDNLFKIRYDLFGIFNSLDHAEKPKKIFEYALNNSKYVIVYCHDVSNGINSQHLYGFNLNFFKNLTKHRIYLIDLTNKIQKYKKNELYILCSKNKKNIERINKIINSN